MKCVLSFSPELSPMLLLLLSALGDVLFSFFVGDGEIQNVKVIKQWFLHVSWTPTLVIAVPTVLKLVLISSDPVIANVSCMKYGGVGILASHKTLVVE